MNPDDKPMIGVVFAPIQSNFPGMVFLIKANTLPAYILTIPVTKMMKLGSFSPVDIIAGSVSTKLETDDFILRQAPQHDILKRLTVEEIENIYSDNL